MSSETRPNTDTDAALLQATQNRLAEMHNMQSSQRTDINNLSEKAREIKNLNEELLKINGILKLRIECRGEEVKRLCDIAKSKPSLTDEIITVVVCGLAIFGVMKLYEELKG